MRIIKYMLYASGLSALGADDHDAGHRKRSRNAHHLAFLILPARTHMLFLHVQTLNNNAVFSRKNGKHLAKFALIISGNYFYVVTLFYFHVVVPPWRDGDPKKSYFFGYLMLKPLPLPMK